MGTMSRGQSQRRNDSRKRPLERCKSKGKASYVIDLDSDIHLNFIILDAPEPSESASLDASTSGKDKSPLYSNIICIDDDDDDNDDEDEDDESGDCGSSRDGFRSENQDSHFTTGDKSQPSCSQGEKLFSKSLKSLGSCSWKISSCRYPEFSSSSTLFENDDSDCYIEEDFVGNVRQQWEEAYFRKKVFVKPAKGQASFQDKVGPSRCNVDSQNKVNVDKTTEPQTHNTDRNHEKDASNPSAHTGENAIGATSSKSNGESRFVDPKETIRHSSASPQSQVKLSPLPHGEPSDMIADREMLKKTDAYKRAQEEELASREKVLQIQREEAQRMRKRRKAETQRLLETERRQKQRVEEVREAQRKDEETLNLKDQLRSEIRRDLDLLEANCRDMVSLLRGLGIDIGGRLHSSSPEVRAAYKQALLRFHPDRASRCNIRQQIEAEEKFKLISRAKEKFML
ncbi:uncharacterized protein LOC126672015 [Mercurialis annua]|uniref:uncharacterized protein LOC126672015 n=1 Tax=Mercurialis annua TaxID=3986 RepID=UPI00215FA4F1|nr:uncharacterized protein LOC126672015 [Mercurialis annua]